MRALSSTLVAMLAAFPAVTAAQTKTFTLQGQDVALYDLVGEMTVERGSGPSVQVEVRPGGKDAGKLTVESTSIGGRPASIDTERARPMVAATRPGSRIAASAT